MCFVVRQLVEVVVLDNRCALLVRVGDVRGNPCVVESMVLRWMTLYIWAVNTKINYQCVQLSDEFD